jgi:hypothetical protein
MGKIVETKTLKNVYIDTPEGYRPAIESHKLEKEPVWIIKTNKRELKGAFEHIVFTDRIMEKYMKDVKIGDIIDTKDGPEEVILSKPLGREEYMYSPSVMEPHNRYYTNGIVSKNTTTVAIFALHYVTFNKDKTVAVLANKMQGAIEILDRIGTLIEELPEFLKPGILEYNKTKMKFENGCKIVAAASSVSAVRGLSINCLTGENEIVVCDSETGDIFDADFFTLQELLEKEIEHDLESSR